MVLKTLADPEGTIILRGKRLVKAIWNVKSTLLGLIKKSGNHSIGNKIFFCLQNSIDMNLPCIRSFDLAYLCDSILLIKLSTGAVYSMYTNA